MADVPSKVHRRAFDLRRISKNWSSFFSRRRGEQYCGLTTPQLVALVEQQGGRCALTGVPLTRIRGLGRDIQCPTNASVDRINPGGTYEISNIQLVCSCVNKLRGRLSIEDFVEWCRRVVTTHDYRALQKLPV